MKMKIETNKVVAVSYELRLEENSDEIIDLANEDHPLEFIFGSGMMLQKFEDNLEKLSKGTAFKFKLTSKEGYGARIEENVSDIPLNVFEQNGKIDEKLLAIGNVIPLQDDKGNHYNGQVISIDDKNVRLDFNHPLAGKDLHFTGKIIDIREATKQELEHGHVHSHGHNH